MLLGEHTSCVDFEDEPDAKQPESDGDATGALGLHLAEGEAEYKWRNELAAG